MTAALLNCGSDALARIPTVQLKNALKKNVLYGFGLSLTLITAFFLLLGSLVKESKIIEPPLINLPGDRIIEIIEFDDGAEVIPEIYPEDKVIVPRGAESVNAVSGETSEDLSFASVEDIAYSSAEGSFMEDFRPTTIADRNINFNRPAKPEPIPEKPMEKKVLESFEVDRQPLVDLDMLKNKIEYPKAARELRIEGNVLLKFTVLPNGQADNIEVMQSDNKLLVNAAMDAVKNMKYEPAIRNGIKVACSIIVPIKFRLN